MTSSNTENPDIMESMVRLSPLRMQIVELMKDGNEYIPIVELLLLIKGIIKDEDNTPPIITKEKIDDGLPF